MRVLVLADTHVRELRPRTLPDPVWAAADEADLILHAGDVVCSRLLDELRARAPVVAVLGNNDLELVDRLPAHVVGELDGVPYAMVHDSGARHGRERRLHARFPSAALVVYGHSHAPELLEGVDGQLLCNPGSCTERRRAPMRTFGLIEARHGHLLRAEIVPI